VTSARDFSGKSTLFNGSWTYGVSAVNATGEYNPNYLSGQNFYLNKLVNNFVSWTSVSAISPSPLFFHVYKNVYSSTGFIQQRLTSPFEVTNYIQQLMHLVLRRIILHFQLHKGPVTLESLVAFNSMDISIQIPQPTMQIIHC
jgi:hypothetical protein